MQNQISHQLMHTFMGGEGGNEIQIPTTSEAYPFQCPYEVPIIGLCRGKEIEKEDMFESSTFSDKSFSLRSLL